MLLSAIALILVAGITLNSANLDCGGCLHTCYGSCDSGTCLCQHTCGHVCGGLGGGLGGSLGGGLGGGGIFAPLAPSAPVGFPVVTYLNGAASGVRPVVVAPGVPSVAVQNQGPILATTVDDCQKQCMQQCGACPEALCVNSCKGAVPGQTCMGTCVNNCMSTCQNVPWLSPCQQRCQISCMPACQELQRISPNLAPQIQMQCGGSVSGCVCPAGYNPCGGGICCLV
uniref:Perlwapin-like n=1 Tax=Haemonchus contortus TaxID=6289 RepID=A0A7I4Z3M1_HAECO